MHYMNATVMDMLTPTVYMLQYIFQSHRISLLINKTNLNSILSDMNIS